MSPLLRDFTIPASELVPAHRIAATVWNPEASATVLCMHGLTRNRRDFDFLAESLADRMRVIALDMPGRGQSDYLSQNAYHYGTYVVDTLAVLSQLGLSRVHWAGTSMGGIIGMMAANAAPGLIQSLVLNDIGCLIPASGLNRILSYAGVNVRFATRDEAQAAIRKNCAPFGITDEEHWQHLFRYGIVSDETGFRFAYDPNIIASFPKDKPIEDVNLWTLWEKIQPIPTLLLRGENSDILTRETAQEMQAKHPRLAYHEITGCGHAPALIENEQKALISNWISARS